MAADSKDTATTIQPSCIVKGLQFFARRDLLNHLSSVNKYRTRFEEDEINHLYWDIELINLLYKKQNNTVVIKLRCTGLTSGKEVYAGEQTVNFLSTEISKTVTHSWGVGTNSFWKADQYLWELSINDKVELTKTIIIDKLGMVSSAFNPYFDFLEIKLYPGYADGREKKEGYRYLSQFKASETQYVVTELSFNRKFTDSKTLEFFLNIIDASSGLVFLARRYETQYPANAAPSIVYSSFDYGNDTGSFWRKGTYLLYLNFMDINIACTQFTIGDEEIAGLVQSLNKISLHIPSAEHNIKENSIEAILAELDVLTGMSSVKKTIRENIDYLKFNKLRMQKGFADDGRLGLHSIFTGNPGTGKTTVVKLLGKIYKAMGLLSKGHIIEATRADIIGEYIGQTAPKTKAIIEKARGGILFLDEVYALIRQDSKNDFGAEAIEILMKEMSDGPGDIAIIGAGYPNEVDTFINSNPGLKSRFTERFHFDDYTPDELMQIAHLALQKEEAILSPEAEAALSEVLSDIYRSRDKSFGNARMVYGVIDKAKRYMGIRLLQQGDTENLSAEMISRIELQDLQKVFEEEKKKKLLLKVDNEELNEALLELNNMAGLQLIKQEVNDKINLVRFYLESGKDVLNQFSLHAVLTGNPGTGKTTLARLLGKIYKALGLLERGHIVEVDRQNLVAGYLGQTALKTSEAIEQAMGGVLFIDEAYSLASDGEDNFGSEAIETLLKMMEDRRGQFSVIAAGYPDNMQDFFRSNPGLQSRFDVAYHLPDYSFEELFSIAQKLLASHELLLQDDAAQHLSSYLKNAYESRDKFFGNARFVRQTVEAIVTRQHLRMAAIPVVQRTANVLKQVILADVASLKIMEGHKKHVIGFRRQE